MDATNVGFKEILGDQMLDIMKITRMTALVLGAEVFESAGNPWDKDRAGFAE